MFVIRTSVVALNLTKLSLDANVITNIPRNVRTPLKDCTLKVIRKVYEIAIL